MGICKYCGKPAGFLKTKHKECEQKYYEGISKILSFIKDSFNNNEILDNLKTEIDKIAENSFIPSEKLKELIYKGWKECIDEAFEDGILTKEEEYKLLEMMEIFGFDREKLNDTPEYEKIVKGAILRDILNGIIPERLKICVSLPFNFQKKEKVIWVFQNVDYYEKRTRRVYVGGYQGFSVRIAKGVYYRVGGFRGNPVNKTETVYVDTGILAVTNKHIYFAGANKSFRIKYSKIVTFEPYSDGIGIQRDAQTAKPQIFVTGDGWFTVNLIQNLAQKEY